MDIYNVVISEQVLKSLHKLPKHIVIKLQAWVDGVSEEGLREMRKISGYHVCMVNAQDSVRFG